MTWNIVHIPIALVALGEYIGKQSAGCVYSLSPDSFAKKFSERIDQLKKKLASFQNRGEQQKIKMEKYFISPNLLKLPTD